MSPARRDGLLAAGVALLALVTFFPGLLFFHQVVFAQDTWVLHIPARAWLVHRLQAGHLPLWYPYDGLGVPYVQGTVLGVFHPVTLLFLVLGVFTAQTVALLALVVLALFTTFLLCRRLGANPAGATLGALAFGLGGPLISSLVNISFAGGIAGFPLLLLGIHHLAAGPRRRLGAVLVSAAVANAILLGGLEAVYLYALVSLPAALVFRRDASGPSTLGRLLAGGIGGLALSAVQLLPSLSVTRITARAHALPWHMASQWSVSPLRLPGLFLGDLLRFAPIGGGPSLGPFLGLTRSPWLLSSALGALVGLGIVWAMSLGAGPRQVRVLLGAAALACLWLALGRHGGLYRLCFAMLPGFDRFRYPAKLFAYATLPLALLGGLGLSAALATPGRAARQAALAAGALLAGAGAAALGRLASGTGTAGAGLYLGRLDAGLLRAAGLVAVAGGALWLLDRRKGDRRWQQLTGVVLVLLELAELVAINGRALGLISADPMALEGPAPFAETMRRQSGPGLGHYRVASLVSQPRRLPRPPGSGDGYLGFAYWKKLALAPDLPALDDIGTIDPYLPDTSSRLQRLVTGHQAAYAEVIAPLFNTRYLVTTPALRDRLHLAPSLEVATLRKAGLVLTRYPAGWVRPRAYLARAELVPSAAAAERALGRPTVRAGAVAVVEGAHPPSPLATSGDSGEARIAAYAPEAVSVDVDVPTGGLRVLVLNDAFYPGWRARLDGRPVPIRPTNLAVRGVLVPPGHHHVTFAYPMPTSLVVGAGISIMTVLVLVGLLLLGLRAGGGTREPDP